METPKHTQLFLKISVFLLTLIAHGIIHAAEIRISETRCQHSPAPMGVETPAPEFSWILESNVRGASQRAYRILVSDSEKKIDKAIGNIWDSGRVDSGESLGIVYSGQPLESGKRYYWRMCAWDHKGKRTSWSKPAPIQMGLPHESDWEGAEWISMENIPSEERIVPGYQLAGNNVKQLDHEPLMPQFRKQFKLKGTPIDYAVIHICGLGNFVLSANGKKVSENFLDPAWSKYDKTSVYVTYDVTDLLEAGDNVLGVRLGNGFMHIPRDTTRYRKLITSYGFPMMRSKLVVNYKDGTSDVVCSDTSWKASPSPMTFSSIYGGEDFDARKEQPGWNSKGFDDSSWTNAIKASNHTKMKSQTSPPLGIRQRFSPVKIYETQKGIYIYDFGQNASGIIELHASGKSGDKIVMRPGEYLTEEGLSNQNNSGCDYFFSYTLRGDKETEIWSPVSSYYGFRYIELRGAVPQGFPNPEGKPEVSTLEMLHISNGSESVGDFNCSNSMFNDIFSLIGWSIKSNLSHVLTDCPHREKLGWLEVAHLMSNSIAYNFDIRQMYSALLDNIRDCQQPSGLVPNTAPEFAEFPHDFRDSPEWGSSAVILPWFLYKWYGDKSAVENNYDVMKRYTDYLTERSEGNILFHGLGDWYDLGPAHPGYSQLTVRGLTPTAIYYHDLRIMEKAAHLIGKDNDAIYYSSLADTVKRAFNEKFFNNEKGFYDQGSQTANALPLYLDLVEGNDRKGCLRQIVADIRARGNGMTSGDIGFSYLIRTLLREGESQLVYDMNCQSDRPGYGYQLKKGATSLTESWEALQTASHNHCMLGHLMEWLYGGLGGIRPEPDSEAFREFIINPEPAGDIDYAKVSFRSPYGMIENFWKKEGHRFHQQLSVPVGTKAHVYLPAESPEFVTESGHKPDASSGIKFIGKSEGKCVFEVKSGTYDFVVKTNPHFPSAIERENKSE